MILGDFATYLQTNGIGTVGTNIFADPKPIPAKPNLLVYLMRFSGSPTTLTCDGCRIKRSQLRVVVRGDMMAESTGEAKANAISDLLDGKAGVTIGSDYYLLIHAQGEPESSGPDREGRPMWEQTFDLQEKA